MPTEEIPLTGNPFDPVQRGWLIGVGGQYTVHDIGHGRVAKIPNSLDGTRRFVGGWGPHIASIWHKHRPLLVKAYHTEYCVPHILRLAARYPPLYEALARPRAMAGPCFTQDKVDGTLGDAIRAATDADVRCYLDATADIYQLLWRYGIHDYVWYFLLNNGIDSTGKVVCLDFGETFFDSTWVAERVDEARWEVKDNLIKALTPDQQDYYFKAMKSRLSGENFNNHWGAALDDLDREVIKRPILAERSEEIPSLVDRILERANEEAGRNIKGVSHDVLDLFDRYTWYGSGGATPDLVGDYLSPRWTGGGVELQNVLYRAAESCQHSTIQLDDLPPYIHAKVNGEQEPQ